MSAFKAWSLLCLRKPVTTKGGTGSTGMRERAGLWNARKCGQIPDVQTSPVKEAPGCLGLQATEREPPRESVGRATSGFSSLFCSRVYNLLIVFCEGFAKSLWNCLVPHPGSLFVQQANKAMVSLPNLSSPCPILHTPCSAHVSYHCPRPAPAPLFPIVTHKGNVLFLAHALPQDHIFKSHRLLLLSSTMHTLTPETQICMYKT